MLLSSEPCLELRLCIDMMTSDTGSQPVNATDPDVSRRHSRRSVRAVFGRLLENAAVPKLILLTVALCAVYVVLRLSVDFLDVHRLTSLGVLAVYVDTVSALVNATNSDVVASAADYNSVLMPAFSDLVLTQISNLHELITHFNHGQLHYQRFHTRVIIIS